MTLLESDLERDETPPPPAADPAVEPSGLCQICGARWRPEDSILCRACGEPVLLWGWAP